MIKQGTMKTKDAVEKEQAEVETEGKDGMDNREDSGRASIRKRFKQSDTAGVAEPPTNESQTLSPSRGPVKKTRQTFASAVGAPEPSGFAGMPQCGRHPLESAQSAVISKVKKLAGVTKLNTSSAASGGQPSMKAIEQLLSARQEKEQTTSENWLEEVDEMNAAMKEMQEARELAEQLAFTFKYV